MIIEYKKENEIAFEKIKDKECFFSNGVLYMKIFSQDLREYNIDCVNAISIINAGLTKFDNNEMVIKVKRIITKQGKIYMSKKYYPIEDAVNNVSQKFKLGLKDANEMDEEELSNAEKYILKYVKFVSHPDYAQLIPQSLETGEYILQV